MNQNFKVEIRIIISFFILLKRGWSEMERKNFLLSLPIELHQLLTESA